MHNLHYVVVTAGSPEGAIEIAEMEMGNWGNENNWYRVGGCVSQDNEVYVHNTDSRWTPEPNHTIDIINKQVEEWLKPDEYNKQMFQKCSAGSAENVFMWLNAKKHCEHMYEISLHGKYTFDILEDSFYSWEFDENGVTQVDSSQQENDDPMNKKYVVFVDMHS